MSKTELTKGYLVKEWKKLERESGKRVGTNSVCRALGLKRYHIEQLLQGESLTDFKIRHGIQVTPQERPYTQDGLLEKYDRAVSKYKKVPSWSQIKFATGIPDSTFKRKFNHRRDIVKAYEKWLKKHKPTSRNLNIIKKWLIGEDKPDASPVTKAETSRSKSHVSEKTEGRTYGKPLMYENMVYGPANEQGVVILFAIMSRHLRYNIEGVWQDSFPDCEATRVERGGKRRRVKIEFEYKSKDFLGHSYDPKACDVIVCWEDNWKDHPPNIEVLELSKEVEKIRTTKK